MIDNPQKKRFSYAGIGLNFLGRKSEGRKKSFMIADTKTKAIINETKEHKEILYQVEKDPTQFIKNEINRIEKRMHLQNNTKMGSLIEKLDDIFENLKIKYESVSCNENNI